MHYQGGRRVEKEKERDKGNVWCQSGWSVRMISPFGGAGLVLVTLVVVVMMEISAYVVVLKLVVVVVVISEKWT